MVRRADGSAAQLIGRRSARATRKSRLERAWCPITQNMAVNNPKPLACAAAVMAAAAGTGLERSPSHRKRSRAQRSFTTEDAQVIASPPSPLVDAEAQLSGKVNTPATLHPAVCVVTPRSSDLPSGRVAVRAPPPDSCLIS